ncbi:MbtH family protein [Streptomyces tagetis]|uniref:MbtH family protein n=1 Tax=Streptomyces tagetis TaxID=2820809 RepID=A0A940XKB6_9ACTN|nr:MbtH family protein [Streptomyces sp. RG38]MBQ0825398.1 MbtH family protein [Streptomyces sp. RG38]
MSNPFDDEDGTFTVVVNHENQHALWPAGWGDLPAGWTRVHGPADRRSCVDHVDAHWTDMRPASPARTRDTD